MISAKEIDGELWIRAADHHQAIKNAQRTWVGLTDEERDNFWKADQMTSKEWEELFDAIETKLKEKNNG